MIHIVAKVKFKPNEVDNFVALAKELVRQTRLEDGCISYKLCQDMADSTVYAFIEEWQDIQAIERHNQSEHFTSIVPQFSALMESPMEVNLFSVVS